jgi:hypothetical protein
MLHIYYIAGEDINALDTIIAENISGCVHFSTENDEAKKIIEQENLTVFPVLVDVTDSQLPDGTPTLTVTKLAEGMEAIQAYRA